MSRNLFISSQIPTDFDFFSCLFFEMKPAPSGICQGKEERTMIFTFEPSFTITTFQDSSILDEIKETGHAFCRRPSFPGDDESIWKAYEWMRKQHIERVGPCTNTDVRYPLWGWLQQGPKRKPIKSFCDGEDCNLVKIVALIPIKQLLLSDFELWHAVLNDFSLSRKGDKERSWNRIFDLDSWGHGLRKRRNRWIQATFWEIRKEWICSVEYLNADGQGKTAGKGAGDN